MSLDGGGPARAASIRERNERLVLRLIFRKGPLSQSEAAKLTGLKPPTVFRIFSELERAGLIAADPSRRAEPSERKGRRPQDYRVVPSAAYAVGVDFWAGSAAAVVQDFSSRLVASRLASFEDPPDAESAQAAIETIIREVLAEAGVGSEALLGIGVGAPGSVSVDEGVVHFYSRIPGMRGYPLGARLKERFGVPVSVHNNASVVAMAEHRYGVASGVGSLFAFLIRSGLGGAYLQGGKALVDRGRTAFEVGHLSVDMRGQPCSCGNSGCLETYLSEDAFLAAASGFIGTAGGGEGIAALDRALAEGRPGLEEALAPSLAIASAAVRNIRRLLAPEAVLFVTRSAALSSRLAVAASADEDCDDGRFGPPGAPVLAAAYDPLLACRAACDLVYDAFFEGGISIAKEEP
ncbi:MAG TPA: ROK family transcriptional regulator [Rectinemataceae bacterium]|nr:ROK family transcriptional regulator [Rectinemataceae bacterium]